ncbi:MAG: hypothetical protein TU35_008260 [Thermoproteus sp. AZ2]|uniref:Uncharacterized protein n=1 Tax=Thermoproteus sp. AZ2 TaxID=1609232 RepID=A0ACC6V399_9CREN|nr:MAG: hypothetical protein TU36_00125 [Vulcanisaeta sp. AZ3]
MDEEARDILGGLARGGVDVRLVVGDGCDMRRRPGLRPMLYIIAPALALAALIALYSPYLAVLIGLLGALAAFTAVSRQAARALSGGWVKTAPSNSGLFDLELFIIDDEALVARAGAVSDAPIDDAVRYFFDVWRAV